MTVPGTTPVRVDEGFSMTLGGKRQLFVAEYLVDLNATQAARRAGYSESTARLAYRFLKDPETARAIRMAKADRAGRLDLEADTVVLELARIAFADPGDFFEWGADGLHLVPSADLNDRQRAAIAEVSQTVTRDGPQVRIRLHDRLRALEYLGRHLGLLDPHPKGDADLPAGLADRIRAARSRLRMAALPDPGDPTEAGPPSTPAVSNDPEGSR